MPQQMHKKYFPDGFTLQNLLKIFGSHSFGAQKERVVFFIEESFFGTILYPFRLYLTRNLR